MKKTAAEYVLERANEARDTLNRLKHENEMLKNRCAALTAGTMCMFCPYECENRSKEYRGKLD